MFSRLMSPLPLAHWYVKQVVGEGDTAIDCTAGKGRDTLFLAQLVGRTGTVYSFDIQENALKDTERLLEEHAVEARIHCILSSHEYIDQFVPHDLDIAAVMFNLGYLPGSDHSITTHAESTILALDKALKLIRPGGVVTVVVYTGHPAGSKENCALVEFTADLNKEEYGILVADFLKVTDQSPRLFVFEK